MKIYSILVTYWTPGNCRGKRFVAATNGGKIFSVGHIEYGGWGTGGDWWRGLAPWGITHHKFRGVVGLALHFIALAGWVHVVIDEVFFFLLVSHLIKLE